MKPHTRSQTVALVALHALLLNPLHAEPFLWDGDCLNHPGTLSNRWHVQCQILVGLEMDTNWNTDRLPDWDADISVPAGIGGGTRITTSFATRANTIQCLSPLLVNGGGPIFINDPSQPSLITDLDLERGQLNVRSTLTLSGTTRFHRAVLTDFIDDEDGGTVIVDGTLSIEGVAPDPFANTIIDPRRFINRGTVTQTGDYSTFTSTFTNESSWTIAPGVANFGGGSFINTADATLTKNGPEPVDMYSRLENHGDVNLTAGTLHLTAADNLLAAGTIDVIPGADLVLTTGFPDFGVPHASLNFTGGSIFATGEVNANPTTGFKIEPGASVTTSGPDEKSTTPLTFNQGTITHNAGSWATGGIINHPDATLTIDGADAELSNNLRPLRNEGTLRLVAGSLNTSSQAGVDNQATFTWTGGKIETAEVTNHQTLDIVPGDAPHEFVGSVLTDNGTTTLHPGTTLLFGRHPNSAQHGRWTIAPTATFLIQNTRIDPHPNGVGNAFISTTGTLTKSGSQTTEINVPLKIDGGTVNINAGTLALNSGARHQNTATINTARDTTLKIGSSGHEFAGNHTVTGDGNLDFAAPGATATNAVRGGKLHIQTATNYANLDVTAGGELALSGDFTNRGRLHFDNGQLTSGNDSTLANWQDEGTLVFTGDHRYDVTARINNSSTLEVTERAKVNIASRNLVQFDTDESNLTGGTWIFRNGGALRTGARIRHNHATVEYYNIQSTDDGIDFSGVHLVNEPDGIIRLLEGSELSITIFAGPFTGTLFENNGTLFVDATSKVIVRDEFETNPGSKTTINGELMVFGDYDNDGGTLNGTGTIASENFNNRANLNPGASPGQLTITGNFTQPAAGSLTIEIAGTTPGSQHDQLAVTGTATLGGTLELALLDDFQPTLGQSFTVLTAAAISGQFTTVNVDPGAAFEISYTATEVIATATAGNTGTAYSDWRSANFSPAEQLDDAVSGPTANPDHDTLTNLLEFAFGLDPRSPDPSPLTVAHDPGTDTIRLSFPWADQRSGLTRLFHTSPDLKTWTGTPATLVDSQPDGTTTRLHYSLPAANPFARLEVTLDP